jgi:Holliday junction resolvasome RuvABC DNA-binding subunit
MNQKQPSNEDIANLLEQIADLLEDQGKNEFRVRAYRAGAESVRQSGQSVAEWVREDRMGELKSLPGIGEGLAAVIAEYVETGQSKVLEDLRAHADPVALLSRVPGIGPTLAQRIVDRLGIRTLPELEEAAYNGRLEEVEGFGPQRVESIRLGLAGLLSGAAQRRVRSGGEPERANQPEVPDLLAVDAEYRRKSQADELPKIAPKRFNPSSEAWLPILHTKRAGWSFTALFSNTAQAHNLGKTGDWVVIYYEKPGVEEDQVTVVTEAQGPLKGKRVVRGRESETPENPE